jgi:hypothetical protein
MSKDPEKFTAVAKLEMTPGLAENIGKNVELTCSLSE